ncbi:MAG: Sua5 family C-terminal domain-containing protein [Gammaproteobacteria bacterium]
MSLSRPERSLPERTQCFKFPVPVDPAEYVRRLYAALHDLNAAGFGGLLVEAPSTTSAWLAVDDRLRCAP